MPNMLLALLPASALLAFVGGFILGRAHRMPRPFHRHTWKTGVHRYTIGKPSGVRICLDPACERIEMQGEMTGSWFKIDGGDCEHLQVTARRLVDANA
jgi:hypothetical protein